MNKRNLEKLLQQIRDKREREMKEQDMTPEELEMNRKYLDDYIKRLREKKGIKGENFFYSEFNSE